MAAMTSRPRALRLQHLVVVVSGTILRATRRHLKNSTASIQHPGNEYTSLLPPSPNDRTMVSTQVPPEFFGTNSRYNILCERLATTALVRLHQLGGYALHLHICHPAIVPVTVINNNNNNAPRQASTDVPFHPRYTGSVLFQNTFNGKLPATEYPKVNVRYFPHECLMFIKVSQ